MFIFWIEGLSLRRGEKIKSFTDSGIDYTTLMTEAIRVKDEDLELVKSYLYRHGIKGYTISRTNYVPKGTLLDTKRTAL